MNLIIKGWKDFNAADEEPDSNCLLGKHWEIIKLKQIEALKNFTE